MSLLRPRWMSCVAAALVLGASAQGRAQTQDADESPFSARVVQGARFRDHHDRGMSESARRFGREHQGAIILGIDPVMSQGRSLNRIKSLDQQGRVVIWMDDPLQPRAPLRRADDGDGW